MTIKKIYPLLIVVLCAGIIRLIFFTDMVRDDDFRYAYAAFELSEGYFNIGRWAGNARPGLYVPVAFLYWLFEPNSITTLAFPYISSLLTVVLVYGIARLHAGETAGIIAAYIWAFLPLDVHLATDLLADSPLATFTTAAVFLLLLGDRERESRRKWIWYSLSIGAIIWAIVIKPLAVLTIIYIFVHIVWKYWTRNKETIIKAIQTIPRQLFWALLIIAILLIIAVVLRYDQMQPHPLIVSLSATYKDLIQQFITGETNVDFVYPRFTQVDLLLPLGTLFLVATIILLAQKKIFSKAATCLVFYPVFYYEWGSVSTNPLVYQPIQEQYEARTLLFLLPPLAIIISIYLAQGAQGYREKFTWAMSLIALGITGFAWFFQNEITNGAFSEFFALFLILIIVTPILSIAFIKNDASQASLWITVAVLISLGIISLKPFHPYHASYYENRRSQLQMTQKQIGYLIGLSPEHIYSDKPRLVDYASGFQLGYDWDQSHRETLGPSQISLLPSNRSEVEAGIVIMYSEIEVLPFGWTRINGFDNSQSNSSIYIYQVKAIEND